MRPLFGVRLLQPVLNFVRIRLVLSCRHKHSRGKQPSDICGRLPEPYIECACKVALIIGGSEGIGYSIAHHILSEKARHVAIVGINSNIGRDSVTYLNHAYGRNKAIYVNCDVKCEKQVRDCYEKVTNEYGKPDIVVNSAGILDGLDWKTEIETNLMGTIHSTIQALEHMTIERGGSGGAILNISGIHGLKPCYPAPTLAATNYAIIGVSRSFGDKYHHSRTGVRVLTLCPGFTDTNFVKDIEERGLNPRLGKELLSFLSKEKHQKVETCGKAAVHVLRMGQPGSVWVVEGSKLYSLTIPQWQTYRKLESQLL